MNDLLDFATNEQGFKSVMRAFKEAGPDTLDRIVKRMCEPAKRRVSIRTRSGTYIILMESLIAVVVPLSWILLCLSLGVS